MGDGMIRASCALPVFTLHPLKPNSNTKDKAQSNHRQRDSREVPSDFIEIETVGRGGRGVADEPT